MTTRAHHIHHRSIHDGLHPLVYRSIIGLTLWLVLSIWAFFSTGAYVELTLAMITVFFVVVVAIPVVIWMTWHHNAAPRETRTFDEVLPRLGVGGFRHLDRWSKRPRGGDSNFVADRGGVDRDDDLRLGVLFGRTEQRLLTAL